MSTKLIDQLEQVRSKVLFSIMPLIKIKKKERGFPGGAVVGNLPASAGNTGSSPGLGRKIPHAAEQLGP